MRANLPRTKPQHKCFEQGKGKRNARVEERKLPPPCRSWFLSPLPSLSERRLRSFSLLENLRMWEIKVPLEPFDLRADQISEIEDRLRNLQGVRRRSQQAGWGLGFSLRVDRSKNLREERGGRSPPNLRETRGEGRILGHRMKGEGDRWIARVRERSRSFSSVKIDLKWRNYPSLIVIRQRAISAKHLTAFKQLIAIYARL